jgi:tetratricopeptide (TPR) repeat protein
MASRSSALIVGVLAASVSLLSCSGDPQKSKVKYLASADRYFANKDYAAAIIEYRKAIAQDAHFGEARLKLGNAYQAIGDTQNAYAEHIRAADLMPDNVQAQLRAGSMLLSVGQYPEAKARALAALAKDPKNVDGLVLMGNALAGLKDFDNAINQVEEALENNPSVMLAYANLGMFQLAKGQRTAAEAAFKRATNVDPKSVVAHLNLGSFYWSAGQLDEAEREFKTAFNLDAKAAATSRALATFYTSNGRRAEAEPFLKIFSATDESAGLVLADYYLGDGRFKEAVAVLEPLSNQKNSFVPAKLRLAALDFGQNRRPQAYATLEEVLKREPTNGRTLEMKARFLVLERRFDEALKIVDSVIKRDPSALGSFYIRGVCLKATDKADQALDTFQELLKKVPSSVAVQLEVAQLRLARGDVTVALEVLSGVVKAHPRSGPAHFLLGQALLRTGDLDGAERQFVGVTKGLPSSGEAQAWLGLVYQAKRDLARSRSAFNHAEQVEPKSRAALIGLLSADLIEKKYDSARARVQSALAERPKDAGLLVLAGNTYVAMNDTKKAESAFGTALEVDSTNLEAFSKLAVLYHAQGRLEEAKTSYEQFARLHEKPVVAMTFLGMIAELQKNPGEARKRYQRALELDSRAAIAANNLAWMYAETSENLDLALELAQTAKAQLPDVPQVNDTLGWVYYKKGMATLAVTYLREASRQGPARADIQYRLGLAYMKAGDQKNARLSLEQALKMNPQLPEAAEAKRALATLKG